MHWLKYSLLVTILYAAYCPSSADEANFPRETDETTLGMYPRENEVFYPVVPESAGPVAEKRENDTRKSNIGRSKGLQLSLKSGQKRELENITFNDIKPFLQFPIFPFLFAPREEENFNSGKNEFSRNETSKTGGNPTDMKPFIFFDFAFNIRRIPVNNATDNLNDSKAVKVKKLSIRTNADDSSKMKNRRRRNTKMETPTFFDDAPLFPDSEMDEFLPKPDLFFPDLPFHHKTSRKLSRQKRDQKKMVPKRDLKSFLDAFDEAFMRTKRELEWTNPLLNFLRGGEQAFDEEKKDAEDLFDHLPEIQEEPSVKWRIQRNIEKMNNDHRNKLAKAQDTPTIIVDKVVKIGEFHVRDDGHDNKGKRKRERKTDSKRKFLGHDNHDENGSKKEEEIFPKRIFELIEQEGSKRKKRNHLKNPNVQEGTSRKLQFAEVRSASQMNTSFLSVGGKPTAEPDQKETKRDATNNTKKLVDLMKMLDSLRGKMRIGLKNNVRLGEETASLKDEILRGNTNTKRTLEDDLRKNLTELLKQFLALDKNFDDSKLGENLEGGERDDGRASIWAEKEAPQNTNILGKGSRVRKQKDAYFEDEYMNAGKERQVADLNYLFLNVTLPTVFVIAVVLLVCFFSLQVKGKICTKLFRPRQVLIVKGETTAQMRNPLVKKVQAI